MKTLVRILCLALACSPVASLAQVGGVTSAPVTNDAPTGEQTSLINAGFDDVANQVYVIFSGPVAKTDPLKPVDGFTLWINNIVRPLVNSGGEIGSLSVEAFVSPVGIDIKPTDKISISYSPDTNPLVSLGGTLRVDAIPVTPVTSGLSGDTSCPRLQPRLIGLLPEKNIFIGYFNERIGRTLTVFQDYNTDGTFSVGETPVINSVSLSLGSNIATRTIGQSDIDWTQPITIPIDEGTSITDLLGNKACADSYTASLPGITQTTQPEVVTPETKPIERDPLANLTPAPTETASTETVTTSETTPPTNTETNPDPLPSILSATISEKSGDYKVGTTLNLSITTSLPVSKSSVVILELNAGSKRVLVKPTSDNTTTLTGSFTLTNTMVSESPLSVQKIVATKLISSANPKIINTDLTALWLNDPTANLGSKKITVVQ